MIPPGSMRRGFLPDTDPATSFQRREQFRWLDEIGHDLPSLLQSANFREYARTFDIPLWDLDSLEDEDLTIRLIRAIISGCKAETSLNAWYDSHAVGRRVLEKIDLGIAVDTKDGLFVPVLRDVGKRGREDLRGSLNRIKEDVRARKIPAEELRGYTFTLSNFGTFGPLCGSNYCTPIRGNFRCRASSSRSCCYRRSRRRTPHTSFIFDI